MTDAQPSDQLTARPPAEQPSSDQLYLERLAFRPELKRSLLNFFIVNFRVVLLLILLLSALGTASFLQLPRESNPEVKIPIVVVTTVYPGASPADMEELVTKKIETGISGLKNVNKVTSRSANSLSSITVEFDAKANLDDSQRKLRDAVTDVKKDLPADAKEPVITEVSLDDAPVWTASFTGPADGFTLRDQADDIKDALEKIPGVRTVRVSGGDERELSVSYDPGKLLAYHLAVDQANQAIRAGNAAIPSGTFRGNMFDVPVRTDARFFDAAALAKLPVAHTDQGAVVSLADVATVRETAIDKTVLSRFGLGGQGSQPSITIEVVKKTGGSILQMVKAIDQTMQAQVRTLPAGTSYAVIVNNAERIDKDFHQLSHDFLLTLFLVFSILFLIVGLKEALVAGLAIPLVFSATFGVMLVTGISLNFLSLFSLILSLGLLVDDAIVVVSATKQYLQTGKFTPEQAVLLVLNDFKVVLIATTLTTVWAFLPLLSASGIIGEYIKSIPITVSVTIMASLLIALFINHPLAAVLERVRFTKGPFAIGVFLLMMASGFAFSLGTVLSLIGGIMLAFGAVFSLSWYRHGGKGKLQAAAELSECEWQNDDLIKHKLKQQTQHADTNVVSRLMHGLLKFHAVLPFYERALRWCLASRRHRSLTLASVSALFAVAVSLPIVGIVKTEFFPTSDFDLIYVDIEGPTGLDLRQTERIAEQVEQRLSAEKDIASYSTLIGVSSALRPSGAASGSQLASITVKLAPNTIRNTPSYELAARWRQELADIHQAKISVVSPAGGPPAGADFDAQISGDDLQTLDRIAQRLKPRLESLPGVFNADISLKNAPAEYTFALDANRLEQYQLNAASVGSTLRTAISSSEITTVIRQGKEIKVQARFDKSHIPTLDAVQHIQLLNAKQQPVFLKDIARITLVPSVDTVTRINRKRVVELTANVDAKHRPAAVVQAFQKLIKQSPLPAGYTIAYGGQNEQNNESVLSILRAMVMAALLIVSTLVIQFNSFRQSLIVLVTIPLALIGVFFGLAVSGIYLSFPGLIGMVALFGIVVKNAIILVDKMNLNIRSGIAFVPAIIDAGKSRLEAIFITSICTICGIIPITLSNATWKALGGAIIFGLMLSSFFTLFIVPTLYMIFEGKKAKRETSDLLVQTHQNLPN